jgi:thiol-disulfide isomerase/thioredoxin
LTRWQRALAWKAGIGFVGVLLIAWAVVGGPFVRGLVAGLMGAFVTVGVLIAMFARRARRVFEEHLAAPSLPTGRWDYGMRGKTLAGSPVDFASYRGKVLVLNFWATWCTPCVAEMPGLERLWEATADLGVAFACVTSEELDEVRRFVEERNLKLPVLLAEGETPELFRVRSIPATFVIDRTGLVVMRHRGAAAWDDDSVVAFVRGLAATPGPS